MKLSEEILQAAENAGNTPYLLFCPKREDPSLRTTADKMYLSLNTYLACPKTEVKLTPLNWPLLAGIGTVIVDMLTKLGSHENGFNPDCPLNQPAPVFKAS